MVYELLIRRGRMECSRSKKMDGCGNLAAHYVIRHTLYLHNVPKLVTEPSSENDPSIGHPKDCIVLNPMSTVLRTRNGNCYKGNSLHQSRPKIIIYRTKEILPGL